MFDPESIPKNEFEQERDALLAAIYTGRLRDMELIYKNIAGRMESVSDLSEVDLKAIYQVQHIFRTFRTAGESTTIRPFYVRVKRHLARITRDQTKKNTYIDYHAWREITGLSREQYSAMLQTVSTVQLTVGCSNCCRRCNEWALPGPRKHFTFDAVKSLIQELFDAGNNGFILYCASDPIDWKHKDKNIIDLWDFMSGRGYRPQYGLLTKIPKGSQDVIESLLRRGADLGFSVTDRNRLQVEKIEKRSGRKLDVQHDVKELLIPAGLDDDFSTIKSSITDNYGTEITPEGAFSVIPTFTSPLNPTGQRRIPILGDASFFLKKKVGRDALQVQYFKPLDILSLNGRELTLKKLLEPQIENILLDTGREEVLPPGMMTIAEYFETYAPKAVEKRRSLLPAVSRKLIHEFQIKEEHHDASLRSKRLSQFRQHLLDYEATCRMDNIRSYRMNAFSFYLKAAVDYLTSHPVEREIISFLRRNGRVDSGEESTFLGETIRKTQTHIFDLFQSTLAMLVKDPASRPVQEYLAQNPVNGDAPFL